MPDTLNLLVVEDEAQAITDWRNRLELYNADTESRFEISAAYADSLDQVRDLLPSRKFDAAVVDLRLRIGTARGEHNAQGNAVVDLLATTEVAAVAVYTGQPGEAVLPESSPKIRLIEKGEGLDSVIDWLKAESKLIFKIQRASNKIQTDMAMLFHRSIWPRWKYWLTLAEQNEALLDTALTRHLVSHLYASLLGATSGVHPEEWYFVPPIESQSVATGDLIHWPDGKIEVVITPRCDIAHSDKSKTIQLAECEDASAAWEQMQKDLQDTTKANKAKAEIKDCKQHKKKAVLHFIPQMIIEDQKKGPWFVRFDSIRSVEKTSASLLELHRYRFASITSEFLPSLVERLGNFFSRIGSPDLS